MARRKQSGQGEFDRQQIIDYLRSRGIETKSTNEAYLKRIYNSVRKQEEAGEKPSLKRARRGTEGYRYRKEEGQRGSYSFTSLPAMLAFVQVFGREFLAIRIKGLAKRDSPRRKGEKRDLTKPVSITEIFGTTVVIDHLQYTIELGGDITDFANGITANFYEFQPVTLLSIME